MRTAFRCSMARELYRYRRGSVAALYSRPIRLCPDRARVRGSREDGFQIGINGERGFLGRHLSGTLSIPSSRRDHKVHIPFMDNNFRLFTMVSYKLSPRKMYRRSIATQVPVNKQEVIKGLELFLSTVKDETTKEMCGIYIEQLCRSGKLSDAAYLFSHLHNRQVHLNCKAYNTLLTTAVEANDFDLFSEIFRKLLLSTVPPDYTSYANISKAFQKVVDANILLKFIKEVSEITGDRDPTVINMIIFFTAKSGQIEKSLMIFEELKNLKCKMDTVTFNTVLAILGRSGRVDEMLSEFNLMKDLGHTPDIVTYNTLINCLRRLGRLDLCKVFAKEMLERGFELDLQSYTAIIDALGRAGHLEDAMKIFSQMKKTHRPSVYVYRAMISNLKKAGNIELALTLHEEFTSSKVKLIGPEDFKQKKKGKKKS